MSDAGRGSDDDDSSRMESGDESRVESRDEENADEENLEELMLDEQEEEGEHLEHETLVDEKPLTLQDLTTCLTMLCKTGDGLAHAFIRIDAPERALTDISILETFSHLRYINLNQNKLRSLDPIAGNRFLIVLEAEDNSVQQVTFQDLQYIRRVNLSNNKLTSLYCLSHPQLELLSVKSNRISSFEDLLCEKLTNLHTLELRENLIDSLTGLKLPNLKNLYMSENKLKTLEGMEELVGLELLHLRGNPVVRLKGLSEKNAKLQQINLRATKVANINELKRLYKLPALQILTLMESPLSGEEVYRAEVLIHCGKLQRLDKDSVNDEEKQEAEAIRRERHREGLLEFDEKSEQEDLEEEEDEGVEEEQLEEEMDKESADDKSDAVTEDEDEDENDL